MKKIHILIFCGLLFFNFMVGHLAAAAGILPDCVADGRCTLCDMVQVAVNIGTFIIGLIGAVTLGFFIYGGLIMLTSAGKADWVKKGKDIIINSTIGLAIVFLAYTGVTAVIAVVTGGWDWENKLTCAPLPAETQYTPPTYSTCGTACDPAFSGGNQPTSDKSNVITPNPGGWADGTACEDKGQCASGFCYEFSDIPAGQDTTQKSVQDPYDNEKGECMPVSSITKGTVCEDSNIDKNGLDDDIPCPNGMSCKDPGAGGPLGTCQASGAGDVCHDKGQCSQGACYDYFVRDNGSIDPDDNNGKCTPTPLADGLICEDANIDYGGGDEDLNCKPGSICKQYGTLGGYLGRCVSKSNGSICFDKSECASTLCWEYGDPPATNWKSPNNNNDQYPGAPNAPADKKDGVGICTDALKVGDKCDDGNVDRGGGNDDATCPPGNTCLAGDWLGLATGTCGPIH
jgi:predicted small integral membrane protein